MKISFQKQTGYPSLGIAFFWMMKIDVDTAVAIYDSFIPELFYDYFFIQTGTVQYLDVDQDVKRLLPQQSLKTIHTQPLTLILTAPLVLFGARLSLKFAESFWQKNLPANAFLAQDWIEPDTADLTHFASQINRTIKQHRLKKTADFMLSPTLAESAWLAHFSPRHKRRLYKSVFGISQKEMHAIQNVHTFLGQACDFTEQSPRIVEYINDDVFYDQPHLNHAFKKVTGFSPLEYFQASSMLQDNLMAVSYNEPFS